MDIKRINPGVPISGMASDDAVKGSEKAPMQVSANRAQEVAGTSSPALGMTEAQCKRSDLTSDRWNQILSASIDALLDRNASKLGPLPSGMREQIAGALAADPYFSKRVFHYLDQKAAQAEASE